jgi:GxxExxY protein
LISRKEAKFRNAAKSITMTENELAKLAVNICFNIHKQYGPGLFESVYEGIFVFEWEKLSIPYTRQQGIKVIHQGYDMGIGFIPDMILDNKIILEFKSIESLADVHYKQLLTYLRLTNIKLGLLINFNVPLIKDGIHRIVNNL